jgi:hypothetical protein
MSQEVGQPELRKKTQQLLDGPLKHIRGAALAAALLPLASVAVAPASAQSTCPASGGVCGVVFNDTNNNGFQDVGETGPEGVKVFVCQLCDGTDTVAIETGPGGFYSLFVPGGPTTIKVLIPTGTQASPANIGNDTFDSDGVPNGTGYSVAVSDATGLATDFGFFTSSKAQPGTGTPGYWKNHAAAWPVSSITVGGITYTKAQAIAWLGNVGKDKTTTMFSSLVPAMLNVLIGNDGSCVNSTIAAANVWMATYGPVGSNVAASSYAWTVGEPLHIQMDSYNNGLLCAPHRQ